MGHGIANFTISGFLSMQLGLMPELRRMHVSYGPCTGTSARKGTSTTVSSTVHHHTRFQLSLLQFSSYNHPNSSVSLKNLRDTPTTPKDGSNSAHHVRRGNHRRLHTHSYDQRHRSQTSGRYEQNYERARESISDRKSVV